MTITEGKAAPAFTLIDTDGNKVSLSGLKGRNVILYFYPRDNTPGCTKEACGFRDLWQQIQATDTVVLGVSPDSPASHRKFVDKFSLPFPLLCDPEKKVLEKYGAWGEKVLYGKKSMGVIRSTVWIGKDGKVVKHWAKVAKAEAHPQQVLDALLAAD